MLPIFGSILVAPNQVQYFVSGETTHPEVLIATILELSLNT